MQTTERSTGTTGGGKKFDAEKLRYDLIPGWPLEKLAEVYTIGGKKYGDWNWKEGIEWSRIYAAIQRHLALWLAGERFAADDKQEHLSSVLWGVMTLMEYQRLLPEYDNRPCRQELSNQYIAGILDGEGYLGIIDNNQRQQFQPRVAIKMTNDGALRGIALRFGGKVKLRRAKGENRKPIYDWYLTNKKDILVLLEEVGEYLTVKNEQCRLIREFIILGSTVKSSAHTSKEVSSRRQEIFLKMKDLNHRGTK